LPRDHLVGDARQRRDLRRDRHRRLVERREHVSDTGNSSVGEVVKLQHAERDDLVRALIEAGGLDVQEDACFGRLTGSRHEWRSRNEPTKDTVVRRLAQSLGHRGERDIFLTHRGPESCRRSVGPPARGFVPSLAGGNSVSVATWFLGFLNT
jgi:hypothetical protein